MIGKLCHFLFRKRTLAVVGVLVVLMVGIGVWLRGNSEKDRETIALAERLLNQDSEFLTTTFKKARVTYDGPNKRTLRGVTVMISHTDKDSPAGLSGRSEVVLMKQGDEWILEKVDHNVSYGHSFWDYIKYFPRSLLDPHF